MLWLVTRSKDGVGESFVEYRTSFVDFVHTEGQCQLWTQSHLFNVQEHGQARQIVVGQKLDAQAVVGEDTFSNCLRELVRIHVTHIPVTRTFTENVGCCQASHDTFEFTGVQPCSFRESRDMDSFGLVLQKVWNFVIGNNVQTACFRDA